MGIFDSHAHYDDERFDKDRRTVLNTLPSQGIEYVINVGCDLKSSRRSIELAREYKYIYAAVGVHPHEARKGVDGVLTHLLNEEKVVALGEIGLDYHYDFSPRDIQKEVFVGQLKLACDMDMPVIIHSREATEDTMQQLEKYKPRGVVHCFSGSAQIAKQIEALGMYVGFTGVITFKNARRSVEAIESLPLDRILIETDCPYMAPEPYRGRRCDSSMLISVVEKIAQIKGVSEGEVIRQTNINAKDLFGIS